MTHTCVIGEADPFLGRLLLRYAEACGLQGTRAQTGQGVLAMVRRERPAVVILDSELPGKMRGWAVIQTMQADPELRDIPLIHCSWQSESEAGRPPGQVAAHLRKPALRYDDFVIALARAGVPIATRLAPPAGRTVEAMAGGEGHAE